MTYDRDSQYHKLSAFLGHVDWERENNPDIRNGDIINKYLDNEEQVSQMWNELAKHENAVFAYNQRLLKAIRKVKGRTFYKHLCSLLEDLRTDEKMELVNEPTGTFQTENDFGRSITGTWVDQWSVGMEGDSFEGVMCVPIRPGKYLKLKYSC